MPTRSRRHRGRTRVAGLALLSGIGLAAFFGPSRDRTGPGRDIILVQIDTLRADRVGFDRSDGRSATPRLDRFARRGSWFADAWACAPWTPPSTMSLLTSLEPAVHGLDLPGDRWGGGAPALPAATRTLAEVLKANGYRTLAVTAGGAVGADFGFARGFDRFHEPRPVPPEDVESGIDRALEWLASEQGQPIFLFFHTYEVHAPNTHGKDRGDGDPVRRAVEAYDRDLAFADRHLGRLFEALESGGRLARAVVVVTSDHGENLHDRVLGDRPVDHGHHLFPELLRIPLLIVAPGLVQRARALPGPVQSIDVMPTLLSLVGVSTTGLALQGRDLRGVLQGREAPDLDRELYFSAPLQGPTWRAVRTRAATLIESPPVPGENWWNRVELPPRSLFDRRADPAETRDLSARDGDSVAQLARSLARRAFENSTLRSRLGDRASHSAGTEAAAALRALGYLGAAAPDGNRRNEPGADDGP